MQVQLQFSCAGLNMQISQLCRFKHAYQSIVQFQLQFHGSHLKMTAVADEGIITGAPISEKFAMLQSMCV